MKRLSLIVALAIVWVAIPTAPASAGLLSSIMTYDGFEDLLTDESVATAIDNQGVGIAGHGVVSVGDDIFGIVRLRSNATHGFDISPTLGEVVIVYGFTVATGPLGGPVAGLAADKVRFTLASKPGLLAALFPNKGPVGLGLIGAGDDFALLADPLPAGVNPTTLAVAAAFGALDGAAYQVDATGSIDFLEVILDDRLSLAGVGILDGAISLPGGPGGYEYAGIPDGDKVGEEAGGFTYTFLAGNAMVAAPVAVTHLWPAPPIGIRPVTLHDATLTSELQAPTGSFGGPVAGTQLFNGWVFQDDTDMKTNLIPEPGPIVALTGLLLVGAAGWLYRRRRKA